MLRSVIYSIIILFTSVVCAAAPSNAGNDLYNPGPYDFVSGSSEAPVKILEYYSLTCPHCENFHTNVFPRLKKEYIDTGKVMWIKRSYMTDKSSEAGTLLLNCIDKSRYEAFLNILLTKQASWAYQTDFLDKLRNIAGLGGMNAEKFDVCMNNKNLESALRRLDHRSKKFLKIKGTPVFYINKKKVDVYSYKSFATLIDKTLNSIDNN
ncbi:MAG: DsbA family protein [Rickettsiales bacterium]|jgi:protein-disulfide isomerase|nr:DsbA family protein [Rickettsiales bacterium]